MKEMTLADHAEAWHKENGNSIPARDSEEWEVMYQSWIDFAFSDFKIYTWNTYQLQICGF